MIKKKKYYRWNHDINGTVWVMTESESKFTKGWATQEEAYAHYEIESAIESPIFAGNPQE